jgi:23S rRNA pseudouridine2605 synthase
MPAKPRATTRPEGGPIRLQVFLARAGVASRRAAEEMIRDGRVTVNGRRAEIGMKVDPATDVVRVDRRQVSLRPIEWIALHKPRGYVTTRDDPEGRRTVYDLLPEESRHLFHVGRLDRDSSGLILFTNDGESANRLLHPRYGTTKEYRVDVEGRPDSDTLRRLVSGVELEDGTARAVSVELRGAIDEGVYRLLIVLEEGRNREVRRLLEAVGHPVRRLFRRSFGPIEIGRLKPGSWRRLGQDEVVSLTGRRRSRRQ